MHKGAENRVAGVRRSHRSPSSQGSEDSGVVSAPRRLWRIGVAVGRSGTLSVEPWLGLLGQSVGLCLGSVSLDAGLVDGRC